MAPGHKTTEAIGYAILALLLFMVPLFIGLVAFVINLNRRARAVAAQEAQEAQGLA
jgi:cbb3-type cytochrome oxidase subunit 3